MTWQWVLAWGAGGSLVYALSAATPGAGLAAAVTYALVGVFSSVATAIGVQRQPRGTATAWWWVLVMQVLWTAASIHEVINWAAGPPDGGANGPDVAYLLGYLPPLVAVLVLLRRARTSRPPGALADATVLGVGLALLCGATVVGPIQQVHPGDREAQLTASLFLAADMTMTVLVVVLLVSSSRVSTSTWLLLAAVLTGVMADSTELVGNLLPTWLSAAMASGWTATSVLWAAAALHPSAAREAKSRPDSGFSPARFVAMLVGTLLAPLTLAIDLLTGRSTASWPAVVAAAVMSVLVVGRLGLALRAAAAALAQREQMRGALEYQARHDSLTGLPNRAAVMGVLSSTLANPVDHRGSVGLLFIDLDGFKAVNDTHGHRAGDELLRVVAARLHSCVRAGGIVGRLGGDEFVVVMSSLEGGVHEGTERARSALLSLAQQVVCVVAEPVEVNGHCVKVGASVGAALVTGEATMSVEALLHEADTAAYRAKAAGRGRVELAGEGLLEPR